jgi:hypothetical protein
VHSQDSDLQLPRFLFSWHTKDAEVSDHAPHILFQALGWSAFFEATNPALEGEAAAIQ